MKRRAWIGVAILALYALASGPAFRLVEEGFLPETPVLIVYAPLMPLSKVPVLRGVIRSYLRFWMLPTAA